MPIYKKRLTPGFQDVYHLINFLAREGDSVKYKTHFKDVAEKILNGTLDSPRLQRKALKRVIRLKPRQLIPHIMNDMRKASQGKDIGGGVTELLHTLGDTALNTLGINSFIDWMGGGYEHKKIPNEAQIFAEAVDESYKKIDERRFKLKGLVRLPEYDTNRYSVWREPNSNQVLLTIHGTKMSGHDIGQDLQILAGGKVTDQSIEDVIRELSTKFAGIDVAAHSLGTQYLQNLDDTTKKYIDHFYLYNPASSPLQDSKYLTEQANDPRYTYFINPSDVISSGLFQKMDHDTVKNNYISKPRFSLLAAHDMSQWYGSLSTIMYDDVELTPKDPQDLGIEFDQDTKKSRALNLS